MTRAELEAALKKGEISGVYLFCGEENFLKRHYVGQIRRAVLTEPAFDAFNHTVLEGARIDYSAMLSAIEAPAMMADKKLIEWHLADFKRMRDTKKGEEGGEGEGEAGGELGRLLDLCAAARENSDAVVLFVVDDDAIDLGTLPKRPSKLYTHLSEAMQIVVFEKSNESQLAGWAARHFAAEGIRVDAPTVAALLARCGHSMDALGNEIEKLAAYLHAHGRDTVTQADIEEITCANGEEDAFGLANAIIEGNATLAYDNLRDMKLRKVDPTVALASVTRAFAEMYTVASFVEEGINPDDIATRTKIHKYRVGLYARAAKKHGMPRLREALALSRKTDAAAKSNMGGDAYVLLELLLAETLAKK